MWPRLPDPQQKTMKNENHSGLLAPASDEGLSAIEKLARSRQAMQEALFPPNKKKSQTGYGTLLKLWPIRRASEKSAAMQKLADLPEKQVSAAMDEGSTVEKANSDSGVKHSTLSTGIFAILGKVGDTLETVLQSRWRKHPAHLALQVGEPLLQYEIRRRPLPWLIVSALAGAGIVLLRPWTWKQPRRFLGNSVGKEVRVLAASGLLFLVTTSVSEWLRQRES